MCIHGASCKTVPALKERETAGNEEATRKAIGMPESQSHIFSERLSINLQ